MVRNIYTIGYSGYKINSFLDQLKKYSISSVIDVRSNPYSQFYMDYNKEALESVLKKNRIFYRNYAKEFGAQQKDKSFYSSDGYLDFEKFVNSKEFLEGVAKLDAGMGQDYTFVLMCAEKDPFNCHRTMMVAREFYKLGYKVIHLLPDSKEQTQADIEMRLLERYFPDRSQLTLFENENLTINDLILKSYRKRNADIGYSLGGES